MNNLGLVLGIALKFYTIMAKGLKLKVKMFWGLSPTFAEVTGEKLVGVGEGGGLFGPSPILNRIKKYTLFNKRLDQHFENIFQRLSFSVSFFK